jgi:hypothetical protein
MTGHVGSQISGQCLCGAVQINALVGTPALRACHCEMCRRHTSSMFMSVQTTPGSVAFSGPVSRFRSSDWAERAFCATCGSTLWYGIPEHDEINLAAGLFDNAAGQTMTQEFFIDRKPQGYALTGDHTRLTAQETIALFAPSDEGESQ